MCQHRRIPESPHCDTSSSTSEAGHARPKNNGPTRQLNNEICTTNHARSHLKMGHRVSRITMTKNPIYFAAAIALIAAATPSSTIEARNNNAQQTVASFPSLAGTIVDQRGRSRGTGIESEPFEKKSGTCTAHTVLTYDKFLVGSVPKSTAKHLKCKPYLASSTTSSSSSSWSCCFVGAASRPSAALFPSRNREKIAIANRRNVLQLSPTLLGAQKSSLSVESRSSSRWEPLWIREYNQNARKNKRRDHLLKVVRVNRRASMSRLQFTDDRMAHEAVNATWDMKHWRTQAQRSLFFLRKDSNGKFRTRRQEIDEVENDSSGCYLQSHRPGAANQRVASCASPARIPKPTVRSSEAEGYAATDVTTLREIFGTNKNKLWGDLDAETARILYHTLLPRALIRLHAQGLAPDELAPLAYDARVAAKKYARERCQVPARVLAVVYDGIRHLKQYGKWSSDGLSWDQLWEKYEKQIQEEIQHTDPSRKIEELTSQVCLRILERSCRTSELVDKIVMSGGKKEEAIKNGKKKSDIAQEVLAIANKFDREIHELLERKEGQKSTRAREFFLMRLFVQTRKTLSNSSPDDSECSSEDQELSFSFEI